MRPILPCNDCHHPLGSKPCEAAKRDGCAAYPIGVSDGTQTIDQAWDRLVAIMREQEPDPRTALLRWGSQPALNAAVGAVVGAFTFEPIGLSPLDRRRRELDALDDASSIHGTVYGAQIQLEEQEPPIDQAFDCSAHPDLVTAPTD